MPYGEVRFKGDIEKMYWLSKYDKRKHFELKTDSQTGQYSEDKFYVSDNLLCVYAAVARGNHAWGVESKIFWEENNYEIKIPENFLHLVGRVFSDKENEFKTL